MASAEKEPLVINMDEASLAYHVAGAVGTVLRPGKHKHLQAADRCRLSDRRGNITYIASICNDKALNEKLPQILLGNSHRFTLKLLRAAKGILGDQVVLWREKSGWNNTRLMQRYIDLLLMSLGDLVSQRTLLLVLDMAPCHIHPDVQAYAMSKGVRMVLVPAGLTWLLQPLDTHVFRQFRMKMQEGWLASKSRAEDGRIPMIDWLQVVAATIRDVVSGRDWQRAFEHSGLLLEQTIMPQHRLQLFGWDTHPTVAPGLPALGQAGQMFPRRSKCNVAEWVHWCPVPSFTPIETLD